MRVVIDSNRVLAAMIKDGTTREILLDPFFEFIAPDFILSEICKYEKMIVTSAGITEHEFEALLAIIFERITIIPHVEYDPHLKLIEKEINDPKDLPYLASSLSSRTEGIWTHDPDFNKQEKVKVFTNIDMLKLAGKNKSDFR